MAYKNVEDRKAASKRHYYANKSSYLSKNKRYRKSIQDFMHNLKDNTQCTDCGIKYPYYVMDFDHLEDKKNNISFLYASGRINALRQEILKCELVCSNCHRERTHQRLS